MILLAECLRCNRDWNLYGGYFDYKRWKQEWLFGATTEDSQQQSSCPYCGCNGYRIPHYEVARAGE